MSTVAQTQSAEHHASSFTSKQRTIALVVVALAFVMDLLDNTIVNIAIPSIQANLGASYAVIQWLIAGYALAFAVLLITGGRMGDVFGYKKLFMIGVAGFTFASLLSGCAWNSGVLIAARLLQGSMAALMVPQVMSLMQVMYKPHERGGIMGIFGALAGVAASLGPVIGGILIHFNIAGLDWRPIFLINVPVGIFALVAAVRYLPNGKSPHPLKLDIVGTVLVMAAMFLLVFPLIEGRDLGWPTWSFIMMACALPVLAIFAWWQAVKDARDNSPLVVPALLRSNTFLAGISVNIIFEGAMIGFFLPFTLILQVGLGFSVIKAALTGIPTAIGISVAMATFAQKIIPKLGRYTMTLGTVVMVAGLSLLYLLVHHSGLQTSPWEFTPGLLIVGVGMALIMSPMFSVVLTDVDPKHAGSASGVLNAVQQLGGALGTALIGVVFFGNLNSQAPASFVSAEPQIRTTLQSQHVPQAEQTQILAATKTCFVDRSREKDTSATPPSCKALQSGNSQTPLAIESTLTDGAKSANAHNFITAFKAAIMFEAAVLAVVFLLSFLLPRHIRPEVMDEAL
ncbi:MAG TPA: MFS transporter [Verrucomicrobiae bacterium]|nr:MFS transporter [Verrucomicrobiae bacterium]